MEYHASENVIELARSINRAIDCSTKPLHAQIEDLVAKLDKSYKDYNILKNENKDLKRLAYENRRYFDKTCQEYINTIKATKGIKP